MKKKFRTIMKTIKVVAGIIKEDNRIFATQRGYGDFAGYWEFPGGKMETGESQEQALIRELKEELNVIVSVDSFFCTVNYDYPSFHLILHCFLCSIISGELTLVEHKAAKWLDKANLLSVNWLPADITVIDSLLQREHN